MNNYYFTFLLTHHNLDGELMAGHWVKVEAHDYMTARLLFIRQFAEPVMGKADKWGFQYPEHNWNTAKRHFHGREYAVIREEEMVKDE